MAEPASLHRPDSGLSLAKMRVDVRRDTRITVQRNVNKDVYIQLGRGSELTMIMHPHAAARLIANVQAVLDGEGFSAR